MALQLIAEAIGIPVPGSVVINANYLARVVNELNLRTDFAYPIIDRCGTINLYISKIEKMLKDHLFYSEIQYNSIFSNVFYKDGYVNFLLSDEYLLESAVISIMGLEIGEISEIIRISDSFEYVHARLVGYATLNKYSVPTNLQHASAVFALAALEESIISRKHRLLDAARKVTLIAFAQDRGFNSELARLIATAMNYGIILN